jgi:glutaminase
VVKPFLYLMALEDAGEAVVHNFVGREPSGRHFNSLNLSHDNIPENPLLDSGAMMCTSLIRPRLPASERYQHVFDTLVACSCAKGMLEASADEDGSGSPNTGISFSNTVYLSMLSRTDRSYCMGHMMQERGAFRYGRGPRDAATNPFCREWDSSLGISSNLELFLQACCIEMSLTNVAILGATLAFGGVNPFTGRRIFAAENVKNCLSLMLSCGMNIYSGQWAYEIGLPAKSGLSGQVLMVVPNVGGLVLYSPLLHPLYSISAAGLQYAKMLNQVMPFHHLKIGHRQEGDGTTLARTLSTRSTDSESSDAGAEAAEQFSVESVLDRRVNLISQIESGVQICYYASAGDLHGLISLHAQGYDLSLADYDGRTGLHLAARSGHLACAKFLVAHGAAVNPVDRIRGTPLTDAVRMQHADMVAFLRSVGAVEGKDIDSAEAEHEHFGNSGELEVTTGHDEPLQAGA